MAETHVDTATTPTVNLGRTSRIPVGQGRCYVVGTHEIAVFRQRDGRLYASENRCPHRGGPLAEGLFGDGRIICPLHGHLFDLSTSASPEPAERVCVFTVKDVNGDIVVDLSGVR